MQTFTQVIDRWPNLSDFAQDAGVDYGTAKQMRRRDSIAAEYWPAIIDGARRRTFDDVTLELLAQLAARKRHAKDAASAQDDDADSTPAQPRATGPAIQDDAA